MSVKEGGENHTGANIDVPLPFLQHAGQPGGGSGSATIGPAFNPPVSYQVELMPPGIELEGGPIILPEPPVLSLKGQHDSICFSFHAAKVVNGNSNATTL